jgi:hypothetical protein
MPDYQLPNDEMEQNRLGKYKLEILATKLTIKDMQHHLFDLTFDGKLALAPISNPQMVLDMGTGTGVWAIDYGLFPGPPGEHSF